jgi:dipeptide/tripeptide permease
MNELFYNPKYGWFISAVLVLYLTKDLMFNKDNGKTIYHAFSMTSYFTGVIGAMIADSFLGKYRYTPCSSY